MSSGWVTKITSQAQETQVATSYLLTAVFEVDCSFTQSYLCPDEYNVVFNSSRAHSRKNSHPLQGSSSANQPIEVELQSNSATRSSNPPSLQPQCLEQIETTTVKMPTRAMRDEADETLAG